MPEWLNSFAVVSGNDICRDGDDAFQVKRPIWRVGLFRVVSWSAGELSIGHTILLSLTATLNASRLKMPILRVDWLDGFQLSVVGW